MDDDSYNLWSIARPLLITVAACWFCIFWSVSLLGLSTARKVYTRRPRSPLSSLRREAVPGVSVIRPLKGLDPNMYENLESSFLQEYSNYEIIFSVQDKNHQALRVVQELVAKYPAVSVQVVKGGKVVGVNPKINNLVIPFEKARHDILWVLDSNVHVQSGTLARSVDALTQTFPDPNSQPNIKRPKYRQRVGVVHHVPFAHIYGSRETLGSRIEQAFLNSTHAKMYIAINRLAVESCVMGKSNMYRRSDIDRLTGLPSSIGQWKSQKPNMNGEPEPPRYPPDVVTGLPAFSEFLAEDNMIAASIMHELGLAHDMSCDVAVNAIGDMALSDYVQRRVRWIRVRKYMVLVATLLEPFTECLMLGVIGLWSIGHSLGIPWWIFMLVHVGGWLAVDLGVYAALAGHPIPSNKRWRFIGAWVLRELLAFPIWVMGVVGSEVSWRGTAYTVLRNGKVRRAGAYEMLPEA